jgi:hypothetical protein
MRPELMPKRPVRIQEELREPGGAVTLAAPTTFCLDDNYFLLLRRHFQSTIRFVVQTPAGPSTCSWSVADLYPGAYDAMILYRKTGEIAATARAEVFAGVSTPMNIAPLRTEVQGTVTVAGLPLDGGVQIKFIDDVIRWEWKASVDAHGNYRAHLTSEPNDRVCATVERIQPMNHIRECSTFQAGIERFDIDLLPGLLRINVLPNRSMGADRQGSIKVNESPGHSWSRTFKLAEGIRGEYFGRGYKTYRVSVTAVEGQPLTEVVTIALTPENPAATVEFFGKSEP